MELRPSILKVVAYFDLFNYPLSSGDIRRFLNVEASESAIGRELDQLLEERRLYKVGPYYSLHNNPRLADKRQRGEIHADDLLRIAARNAKLLYQFPFVRGICVSGSLSKRCADDRADIDYFIITKANRLWIARTLMHFYKKLSYLRGHQHHYCMNYYVDEAALEIGEKNIFTAIELLTLMPMCGNGGLTSFFDANEWTSQYLPQYSSCQREALDAQRNSLIKRLLERVLNNRLFDRLESYLQNLTDRRWQKKTARGDRDLKGDTMTLQCTPHVSRSNPEIFQKKVLNRYQRKLREVAARWGEPVPVIR